MKLIFKNEPPVLHKKDIREGYLETTHGAIQFKSGNFKQNVDATEAALLKEAAGIEEDAVVEEVVKDKSDAGKTMIEPGKKVNWTGSKGETTGEILEVEKDKVKVKSDIDGKTYRVAIKALRPAPKE